MPALSTPVWGCWGFLSNTCYPVKRYDIGPPVRRLQIRQGKKSVKSFQRVFFQSTQTMTRRILSGLYGIDGWGTGWGRFGGFGPSVRQQRWAMRCILAASWVTQTIVRQ